MVCVILHRNIVLQIPQSYVTIPTIVELTNFSSTLNSFLERNATHLITTKTTIYAQNAFTKSVLLLTNTIGPAWLVHKVLNEATFLHIHV